MNEWEIAFYLSWGELGTPGNEQDCCNGERRLLEAESIRGVAACRGEPKFLTKMGICTWGPPIHEAFMIRDLSSASVLLGSRGLANNVEKTAPSLVPVGCLAYLWLFWGVVAAPKYRLSPTPTFCFLLSVVQRCRIKKAWVSTTEETAGFLITMSLVKSLNLDQTHGRLGRIELIYNLLI